MNNLLWCWFQKFSSRSFNLNSHKLENQLFLSIPISSLFFSINWKFKRKSRTNKWKWNEENSHLLYCSEKFPTAHAQFRSAWWKIFISRDQNFIILTSTKWLKVLSIHYFTRYQSVAIRGVQINRSRSPKQR